jgi:hypothetical protein
MFKCEQYSKPLWKLLESTLNTTLIRTLAREQQIPCRVEMHTFLVMYNLRPGGGNNGTDTGNKKKLVYRKYKRETTNSAIYCNCTTLLAHLISTVKKTGKLKKIPRQKQCILC